MRQLDVADQALFRKVLNGLHITQDCKPTVMKVQPTFAHTVPAVIADITGFGNVTSLPRCGRILMQTRWLV